MTLRERIIALAEDVPMIAPEWEHAKLRALALAAARLALEDAAQACAILGESGNRYATRAAAWKCNDAIRALRDGIA